MDKRGQFQMGFGMIFSLILIAVFIVVAFIAIRAFLDVGCSTTQGRLIQDIQNEATRIWKGAGEDTTKTFKVSGCDFTHICFYDSEEISTSQEAELFARDFRQYKDEKGEHNLFFYPRNSIKLPSTAIDHIDMSAFKENPYCFEKVNDKITIRFKKRISEVLVTLS
jgi:hypothetical protein